MDNECGDCDKFENCDECITNATSVEGDCVCDDFYFFDVVASTCEECHEPCLKCDNAADQACNECDEDYFLYPGASYCAEECPSGYTHAQETNTCEGTPRKLVCFLFDRQSFDWVADGFTAIGGHRASSSYDRTDPVPVY